MNSNHTGSNSDPKVTLTGIAIERSAVCAVFNAIDTTAANEDPLLDPGIESPSVGDDDPKSVNPEVVSTITGIGFPP